MVKGNDHWVSKPIKEVGKVVTGTTPSKKQEEYYGGDIPFVTPRELGYLEPVEEAATYLTDLGAKKAKLIPKNSVMVCCIGSLGKIGFSGRELATNQQINSVIFDETQIDPRYGFRFCQKLKPILEHIAPSTTIAIVNKSRFESLEIPVPPLAEQQRIAAILDQADMLRAKRRAALAKLDTLLQATFLDMFGDPVTNPMGWEVMSLEDICGGKGSYGSGASAIPYESGLPRYIRITDINDGGSLNNDYVSPSTDESDWNKNLLVDGDIVFARSGATVGKTYLHREENGYCVYAGYLIRFHPKTSIMRPEFLFSYTQTSPYKAWVKSRQKVVAQPNINAKQYGQELLIPAPPLEQQDKFVRHVNKMRITRKMFERHFMQLDNLFHALQQRAFKGQL